jgi:DNA-binding transcriptional MerR regulator
MKDTTPSSELPKDGEKQGYKILLDTLRDQLLVPATSDDTSEEDFGVPIAASPVREIGVAFPEGKKYFRIGEVAELIGVEAYVLRYWESEFSSIRPKKSRSGQRIYDRRDVQKLAMVHYLLHVEKFSLQGAKQKMAEMRKQANTPPAAQPLDRKVLKGLAQELLSLIALVEKGPQP